MESLESLLSKVAKPVTIADVPVAFGIEDNKVIALQPDGTRFAHYHRFDDRGHAERLCAKVKESFDEGTTLDMAYWERIA